MAKIDGGKPGRILEELWPYGKSSEWATEKERANTLRVSRIAIFSNSARSSTSFQLCEHGHLLPVERAVPQDGQERRALSLHLRPEGRQGGRTEVRKKLDNF